MPASPLWQLVTVLTALAGLVLITLGITYLLSLVGAVVSRRAFAAHVRALGDSPAEIVVGGWGGSQFESAFTQHLVSLASQLTTLGEQRLAYPVIHYFHPGDRGIAGSVALANISEAVMLLETAVAEDARPPRSATAPVQSAVARSLATSEFAGSVRDDGAAAGSGAPGLRGHPAGGRRAVPASSRSAIRAAPHTPPAAAVRGLAVDLLRPKARRVVARRRTTKAHGDRRSVARRAGATSARAPESAGRTRS